MMSEYGLSLGHVLWEMPLAAGLALWEAIVRRRGGETGPDRIDRAIIAAEQRARRFFEEHFEIVPDEQPATA